MPEIEIFDDKPKDSKPKSSGGKFYKQKWFKVALVGVVGVALYVLWRNREYSGNVYASYPEGYSGYPSVDGGGGTSTDDSLAESYEKQINEITDAYDSKIDEITKGYDSALKEQQNAYEEQISGIESKYDGIIGGLYDQMDEYEEAANYFEGQAKEYMAYNEQLQVNAEIKNAVMKMKKNSEMYSKTTDPAVKQALHNENMYLADIYGFQYDSKSGNYYLADGSSELPIYRTAYQELNDIDPRYGSFWGGDLTAKTPSDRNTVYNGTIDYHGEIIKELRKNNPSSSVINSLSSARDQKISSSGGKTPSVSYDKNTDYQALINKAKSVGASQSVIDTLTAQREAKIKGENLNSNGTKKTTTRSSSKSGSTSSKSTRVTYDKNVDYQAAINKAKASGASKSEINKLQAQREAKIKGENLNKDGSKKTTKKTTATKTNARSVF